MSRRRGMDDERLRVANVREIARKLQRVDDGAPKLRVRRGAVHPEAQDTTKGALVTEVFLCARVRWVGLESEVRHPRHPGMRLEVARERERIRRVPLCAEGERLETLEEKEGAEGVLGRAEVTEGLDAQFDGEGNGTKRLGEFESVIPLGRLCEGGKAARGPIELAWIFG